MDGQGRLRISAWNDLKAFPLPATVTPHRGHSGDGIFGVALPAGSKVLDEAFPPARGFGQID